MKNEIVCIGAALIDSIIRGFDPEPVSASGFRAKSCSLNVGGEAVNESATLASLGIHARILCFLGDDSAGRMVADTLKRRGVDISGIVWEEKHPTPVTTMFVNEDGTRKSITNLAHRHNFHPENHMEVLANADAVMLGSLFRAPFDNVQVIDKVVSEANSKGLIVFADTKLPNFQILSLKDIADILPGIDYITPNEDEARFYSGEKEPSAMAEVFLSYGVKNVIIKLGSKGCYFRNREESMYLPACQIDAVDATGAGDNFIAGFASEILRKSSLKEALLFANACGAVCTTMVGAGTSVKSREQILEFMRQCQAVREQSAKISDEASWQ